MDQCVRESNRNVKHVEQLEYVFDIREWIAPHLEEIHYHTQPHIFLFKKNASTGRAEMFYKQWSHDMWEPSDSGLQLLKV